MTAITLIQSLQQLEDLLYSPERLAYNRQMASSSLGLLNGDPILNQIIPFMINFLDKRAPLTERILDSFKVVLPFFAMEPGLMNEILSALARLPEHLLTTGSRSIMQGDFPISYFMMRASKLTGFPLLALPARDFIADHGAMVIPALLVACSVIPCDLLPHQLTPDHIIGASEKYMKRNRRRLAASTVQDYRRVLAKFLPYVRNVYRIVGCGGYQLFKDEEIADIEAESRNVRRHFAQRSSPSFSHSEVLRPHSIIQLLADGGSMLRSQFNSSVMRVILAVVFYFGSKITDLLKLRVRHFQPEKCLISFDIQRDRLLQQDKVYIPLYPHLVSTINWLLEERNKELPTDDNDFLFVLNFDDYFSPLTKQIVKEELKRISQVTGEPITERSLYLSHRCHFENIGGLNPIIGEIISDRRSDDIYVPRIYTQTTLGELRDCHYRAYVRVMKFLGMEAEETCFEDAAEALMVIGGKRALGKDAVKRIFAHFRRLDLDVFVNATKWVVFLINYLSGSRVAEIASLTRRSLDLDLRLLKFRVKDTLRRRDTTKVIPLVPIVNEAIEHYLPIRSSILESCKASDFPYLLFSVEGGNPYPLTDNAINTMYRDMAIKCGIPLFTSHCLRYQSQTDFTAAGLSYAYTNCLLSHYPFQDLIFSRSADIYYPDFAEAYEAAVKRTLEMIGDA